MKQYSGPVITKLIENIEAYFNSEAITQLFYEKIYNPKTAVGIGLDIWGEIVARSRFLKIEQAADNFGFQEGDANGDWFPFNDGTFFDVKGATKNFRLDDESYRLLILMKAFANISQTTIPNINNILSNIFKDKGRVYLVDLGNMTIRIVFEFTVSSYERAVIESDAIPHPGGVKVEFQYLNADNHFGFDGSGFQPFNTKPFYTGQAEEIKD